MVAFLSSIFGSSNDRALRPMVARVDQITALEDDMRVLAPEQLRALTPALRDKLTRGASLDQILPEAFAAVREAARRSIGLRHYDVQLIGGMVLDSGAIAEMRTGEGKTLVATAPAYLNALEGHGVHVVTVNDYLAQRDADWMGEVYRALGMSVHALVHDLDDQQRKDAYAADITYGTNNELGFDYLRDNMKYSLDQMVQRGHSYAIVDEVDSILIDESRTPLIISGPTEDRSELYLAVDAAIPTLVPADFELDEKQRSVVFTEEGTENFERVLEDRGILTGSLFDPANIAILHHANQALRAHKLFHKDRDYIVKNAAVMLIDEFTGRMTPGRRMSEGLHQAIEAKENVAIQPENQTLASITFQNYFRLYGKMSGMTGTAMTEAGEFADIYGLSVASVPTNEPVRRIDDDDVVYLSAEEKYKAIIADIEDCVERSQPVLVGTVSIDKSETLSRKLSEKKIAHEVLNARHHEREANIIAQAGVPGAITVATNMAGRGTDIQLGGNPDIRLQETIAAQLERTGIEPADEEKELMAAVIASDIAEKRERVLVAGGLYVLGTERHESRRIDNQLRGRTGRQGDPGKSKFYICLEDDLLRIFAAEKMDAMMRRFGVRDDEAIEHPWMNRALETSQKRVEQRNFEIRKNLLKYDDVINNQRQVIFAQRIDFMRAADVAETVRDMRHQVIEDMVVSAMPEKSYAEQWDMDALAAALKGLGLHAPVHEWAAEEGCATSEMRVRLIDVADATYARKLVEVGAERMRWTEKHILLRNVDALWRDHLGYLDQLRSVIHLRGYAQKDPLNEFKAEAFILFDTLLTELRSAVTSALMLIPEDDAPAPLRAPERTIEIRQEETVQDAPGGDDRSSPDGHRDSGLAAGLADDPGAWGKIGRNAPCPCGSGKKYKRCHGAIIPN